MIPTIKKAGFNNLVGNSILNFVNAKQRFKPNEPNNQGRGRPIIVPK